MLIDHSYPQSTSRPQGGAERPASRSPLEPHQRLQGMRELLQGIAHQSRNALQRIQASVEMLQCELDARSEAAEDVASIARAHADLRRLFEELHAYTAPLNLESCRSDLQVIVRNAWAIVQRRQPQQEIVFGLTACSDDPSCVVDPRAMEQVFVQLFDNAMAVSPRGGRVNVVCRFVNKFVKNAMCEFVEISVSDQGGGFQDDQKLLAFQPFFSTKTHGNGLGLAIVQRIINAHGGHVAIGQTHQGTTIELSLPRDARRWTQPNASNCGVQQPDSSLGW